VRIVESSDRRIVIRESPVLSGGLGVVCVAIGVLLFLFSGGPQLFAASWQLGSIGPDGLFGAILCLAVGVAILVSSAKVMTCVFDGERGTVTLERIGVTGGASCEYDLRLIERAFLARGLQGKSHRLALAMRDHEVPTLVLEFSGGMGRAKRQEQVEAINRFLERAGAPSEHFEPSLSRDAGRP
jgi:hypothetical protein